MKTAAKQDTVRTVVARRIVEVQRSLAAFNHGNAQFLSPAIKKSMEECEHEFSAGNYGRAEFLAKVVAFLVRREGPRFSRDPEKWIARGREMHAWP